MNPVEDKTLKVDLALVHYPVNNRNGEIIGSAVTNLDIHDIARASRTFGIDNYYLITPFSDQQQLVTEIIDHWRTGRGGGHNEPRKEAFSIVRLCADLQELYSKVSEKRGERPTVIATSALRNDKTFEYSDVRQRLKEGEAFLILFGTGWGLAKEVIDQVDGFLPPILGQGDYNHLSVRSAVSIILDRLLGDR